MMENCYTFHSEEAKELQLLTSFIFLDIYSSAYMLAGILKSF